MRRYLTKLALLASLLIPLCNPEPTDLGPPCGETVNGYVVHCDPVRGS